MLAVVAGCQQMSWRFVRTKLHRVAGSLTQILEGREKAISKRKPIPVDTAIVGLQQTTFRRIHIEEG